LASENFNMEAFIQSFVDKAREEYEKNNSVNKKEEKNMENKNLKKDELGIGVHSYGAVILNNGLILKIRNNFIFLEKLWKLYNLYVNTNNKRKLKQLLKDTNGGVFDSGDALLFLKDIKILFRATENVSNEEKEYRMIKNVDIDTFLNNIFFSRDFNFIGNFASDDDDYDENEDRNEDDDYYDY